MWVRESEKVRDKLRNTEELSKRETDGSTLCWNGFTQ